MRSTLHDLWRARFVASCRHAPKAAAETSSSVGDFTRSLVNDPPRTLWTRELKVCGGPHDHSETQWTHACRHTSSPACPTPRPCTNAVFVSARVPELVPRCRPASNRLTGASPFSHMCCGNCLSETSPRSRARTCATLCPNLGI